MCNSSRRLAVDDKSDVTVQDFSTLTNTLDASKFDIPGSTAGYPDALAQDIQRYEAIEDVSTVCPIQDLRGTDDMLIRYCSAARIRTNSGTVFANRGFIGRVKECEGFPSLTPFDLLAQADDALLRQLFLATPAIPRSSDFPSHQ
jgi:hypothetical protein